MTAFTCLTFRAGCGIKSSNQGILEGHSVSPGVATRLHLPIPIIFLPSSHRHPPQYLPHSLAPSISLTTQTFSSQKTARSERSVQRHQLYHKHDGLVSGSYFFASRRGVQERSPYSLSMFGFTAYSFTHRKKKDQDGGLGQRRAAASRLPQPSVLNRRLYVLGTSRF